MHLKKNTKHPENNISWNLDNISMHILIDLRYISFYSNGSVAMKYKSEYGNFISKLSATNFWGGAGVVAAAKSIYLYICFTSSLVEVTTLLGGNGTECRNRMFFHLVGEFIIPDACLNIC